MAKIVSLADNSESTSPNSSNVNVYATGNTPMQVILSAGEQVTIAGLNGGNPITTSPFSFSYNASTFPSGLSPVVTTTTPSLAQSVISFGSSTSSSNIVNWTNVPNATSYVVRRSLNSDMSSPVTIYTGTLLTYTDNGLTSSTTYYYSVTASATGYTSSLSNTASKATSASGGTYTLTLNLVGTDVGYTPSWPSGFPNGVGTFTAGEVVTIILEFDGYSVDIPGIDSLVMDGNKSITITATKNPPVFIPQNFNIGSDGVTKSPGKLVIAALNYNLKAVLSNPGEEYFSSLSITGIQAFWHPSMLQTNTYVITGLTSANEPLAGSDIKSGIGYEEAAMVLKTPTGQISTGFYLPQATTSGWRTLGVKGTTNWMIYSFYSINGGNNWYPLDGGIPFDSGILKTAPLYGQVSMSESRDGLTIDLIKYLTI